MALATISLRGDDIYVALSGEGETRLAMPQALPHLKLWADAYGEAASRDDAAELLRIGREIFAWLDETGVATRWIALPGDRALLIEVTGGQDEERVAHLLDAPWELLASEAGHLTDHETQLFVVARRIGPETASWLPTYSDIQLMFMAASTEGQSELDYEQEESALLGATRDSRRVHVIVEESGALQPLEDRLSGSEAPFEALHLSCHGTIRGGERPGPALLLETVEGHAALTRPEDLIGCLRGDHPPALVMLSACRTAERGPNNTIQPFARQLATSIANVVGWDGSVYDRDATRFAATFYDRLGQGLRVPVAAAEARKGLLRDRAADPAHGRHWHLARVYLGPGGGGALRKAGGKARTHRSESVPSVFLDKARQKVPVASREAFVGRRRQIQRVFRAFGEGAPVLVHGMGALGKSSLAERVRSRTNMKACVIFERYDALAIFDAVLEMLPADERQAQRSLWRERVAQRDAEAAGTALAEALETWLEGTLGDTPMLLIVDDLERILEDPQPGEAKTRVKLDHRPALGAVLRAFAKVPDTASKLLLTSRYIFTLPDGRGHDLADPLRPIGLAPLTAGERRKQLHAAERLVGLDTLPDEMRALGNEAMEVAGGNPGLQELLTRPILAAERDLEPVRKALGEIRHYLEHGVPSEELAALIASGDAQDDDNAAAEFFRRVAIGTYRDALGETEALALAAAAIFAPEVPIAVEALEAAASAAGAGDGKATIARLIGLGLIDDMGVLGGVPHGAINPLARPLAPALREAQIDGSIKAAHAALARVWRDQDGDYPFDPRGVEAARLALLTDEEPDQVEAAVQSAAMWLARSQDAPRAALALIDRALTRLPLKREYSPYFIRLGVECADQLGEVELLQRLLDQPLRRDAEEDRETRCEHARLDLRRAERLTSRGDVEQAEALMRAALMIFELEEDANGKAMASGQIADILQQRGEINEALRIRREEQLPVFERLGNVRGRAVTMGQIADILQQRGETDEALRIRREEQLPVFDRLGDVRSRAVTMGRIADILEQRGETDEALRIRYEEELPVHERLGDVRSRAVTVGQIADILERRGETDEALRIRREEQLPVYERLGDVRSRAIAMGKIADTLEQRGETDEALRIRREEELPVFDRLGDVRSRAMTMGKIADILQQRGEVDEALRIRREEELPVFERLGDMRSRAMTMGKIADILQQRGEVNEALRIRREEQLPVFERLGDVRSRAIAIGKIADFLEQRGETDEALRIRREEELPVYERLGDVRSRAVTMGQIADILQQRGEIDEALRIRREEELPVYEHLGDQRSRSVCLHRIALTLMAQGALEDQRATEVLSALVEAYRIATELRFPDGIGYAGLQLAQVLAMAGLKDEALAVLTPVKVALQKIGDTSAIAAADKIIEQLADAAPEP